MKLCDVTKDEMLAFVASYPRKLVKDVCATGEPPLLTFNDFTLGDWPECTVAGYSLAGYRPEGGYFVMREEEAVG